VLDNSPPEGPGVRDDDANLHAAEDMEGRSGTKSRRLGSFADLTT
jgi:hypothetical protein